MSSDSPEFSYKTRLQSLSTVCSDAHVTDALIIGGGIVGAGLIRELSLRGIKSVLVEKGDFANATSSKSSKLIHGGLRYLEMLDFGLVFEALSERHWLLKSHPHLVHPLQFNLPIYKKEQAPAGMRPGWMLALGLWLYDTLSLFRSPFFHGRHTRREVLRLFPGIRKIGLKSSLFYADAMTLDDELVLECIFDAVKKGSNAFNYIEANQVRKEGDVYVTKLTDHTNGKNYEIRSKEVFVCVGPWTEKISPRIEGGSQKKMKPSRGVHLLLPWSKLPIEHCLVMYSKDGRIVFVIPRFDLGKDAAKIIVGTTDAPDSREPDQAFATAEDVDYLLKVLNWYFPDKKITKEDILTVYSGVRPLIDDGHAAEAKTSREHEIWRNEEGVIFMAGGKYTTFRKISEEIADFGFPGSEPQKPFSSKDALSHPKEYDSLLKGKKIWGKFTREWLQWKLKYHCPLTLEDVVFRRIPLWTEGNTLFKQNKGALDEVCAICADHFGWSAAELEAQKKLLFSAILKQNKEITGGNL